MWCCTRNAKQYLLLWLRRCWIVQNFLEKWCLLGKMMSSWKNDVFLEKWHYLLVVLLESRWILLIMHLFMKIITKPKLRAVLWNNTTGRLPRRQRGVRGCTLSSTWSSNNSGIGGQWQRRYGRNNADPLITLLLRSCLKDPTAVIWILRSD